MNFLIIGKHICLRKINLNDANNKYLQWLNDKKINQFLETRHKKQTINSIKILLKTVLKIIHFY